MWPKIGSKVSPKILIALSNGLILTPEAVGIITHIQLSTGIYETIYTITFELSKGIIYSHFLEERNFFNVYDLKPDGYVTPQIDLQAGLSRYDIALKKEKLKWLTEKDS
jgi:hypothetical protein